MPNLIAEPSSAVSVFQVESHFSMHLKGDSNEINTGSVALLSSSYIIIALDYVIEKCGIDSVNGSWETPTSKLSIYFRLIKIGWNKALKVFLKSSPKGSLSSRQNIYLHLSFFCLIVTQLCSSSTLPRPG